MLTIEIPENANCEPVDLRVFHDVEAPRPITHIRLAAQTGQGTQWYALTGWTAAGGPCAALARKVDDSGEGVALLVSGGDAGLRLQPEARQAAWQLDDPQQHGLPFVIVADASDVRFA